MARSVGRIEAEPWAFGRYTLAFGAITTQRNAGFGPPTYVGVGVYRLAWEAGFSLGEDEGDATPVIHDNTGGPRTIQISQWTTAFLELYVFDGAGNPIDPDGFSVSVRRLTPKP